MAISIWIELFAMQLVMFFLAIPSPGEELPSPGTNTSSLDRKLPFQSTNFSSLSWKLPSPGTNLPSQSRKPPSQSTNFSCRNWKLPAQSTNSILLAQTLTMHSFPVPPGGRKDRSHELYLCIMISAQQTNIRNLNLSELENYFAEIGDKKFRAKQVYEWLWQKHAGSFDAMTNLGKELRLKLAEHFTLPALTVNTTQYSADGTVKSRFKTFDDHFVEGVLIPTEERKTACVSSQIGCSLSCTFCATGKMERERNLTFDEIYDQVALINEQSERIYEKRLSNIVFMGMGEPLLNYNNVLRAIDKISAEDGMGMSQRRITVSTAGVAKMIKKLGDDKVRFKLALSLHAGNDKKRNQIMPINESNNIKALIDALNYFYRATKNEVTFEYILFRNFNDSQKDAEELVKIYRQVPADLVNIIEYNPIDGAHFAKPDDETIENFMKYLETNRVNSRLRRSRGKDIDAACGQLANKDNF